MQLQCFHIDAYSDDFVWMGGYHIATPPERSMFSLFVSSLKTIYKDINLSKAN